MMNTAKSAKDTDLSPCPTGNGLMKIIKKTIDKRLNLCYNKDTKKEKEIKK